MYPKNINSIVMTDWYAYLGAKLDRDTEVLKAFQSEVDYTLQKNRNRLCAADTGNWFFHHPIYQKFQNGKGPHLLFLTAEAGGGKSTVMRTLTDKLTESIEPVLVAYFFFKDDDGRLSSYSDALSCLIYQLLVQEPKLTVHIRRFCEEHKFKVKHDTKLMWDVFSLIASNSPRDTFCVIDAIDECATATRPQLVADMKAFFQDPAKAGSRLKLIASSRPYQDESHPYDSLFSKATKNMLHFVGEAAEVQPFIRGVIRTKADELVKEHELEPDIREMLVSRIIENNRHTRSFLAVQMAFELLGSHYRMHSGADKNTVSLILDDIPNQLDRQFDELLNKSLDREHARRIFCIILAARKTIKVRDLRVIYSLTKDKTSGNSVKPYEDLALPIDDEEFKQLVRATCGLFITFVKTSVHLFHQTAREHLLKRSETATIVGPGHPLSASAVPPDESSFWKNSISLQDANLVCAAVCLDIISFPVSDEAAFKT